MLWIVHVNWSVNVYQDKNNLTLCIYQGQIEVTVSILDLVHRIKIELFQIHTLRSYNIIWFSKDVASTPTRVHISFLYFCSSEQKQKTNNKKQPIVDSTRSIFTNNFAEAHLGPYLEFLITFKIHQLMVVSTLSIHVGNFSDNSFANNGIFISICKWIVTNRYMYLYFK